MQKTITVRGTGNVKAKPDCIHLKFRTTCCNGEYKCAMDGAEASLRNLKTALGKVGIPESALKTTDFDVRRVQPKEFPSSAHHEVVHAFKIVLDLDLVLLGKVMRAIAGSGANPDFEIRFTVKDTGRLQDAILTDAAAKARRSAEVLCRALGASLGELLSIDYSWQEIDFYSPTGCDGRMMFATPPALAPDDVDASDSATFIWSLDAPRSGGKQVRPMALTLPDGATENIGQGIGGVGESKK